MEVFRTIVVKGANYLFIVCALLFVFIICSVFLASYWLHSAGTYQDIFNLICISLLILGLETLFIVWLVSSVRSCNRNLQVLHDEWESIYENSQVGIAFLKGGRIFAKGNKRLAEIFGFDSPDEMAGKDLKQIHLTEENYKEFGEKYYSHLSYGSRLHIEYELRKKNGSPIWCQLSGKAVDKSNPANLDKGVVWIIEDISKRKQLEEELRFLAETDSLTGFKNRRSFMASAEVEFERFTRYGSPLSIIMVDIDHFKSVNDRYGHDVGDLVLKEFAEICRKQFRSVDVLGRLGGEEFAILLPSTTLEDACLVARRLRGAFKRCKITEASELKVTASFGIACAADERDVNTLIRIADKALYQAKNNGRDRVEVT